MNTVWREKHKQAHAMEQVRILIKKERATHTHTHAEREREKYNVTGVRIEKNTEK